MRIGSLYHSKHKTKGWALFREIAGRLGGEHEYVGFGLSRPKDTSWLSVYLKNPKRRDLVNLYSSCGIWLSASTLEGFFNVPAEAAMQGCLIVAIDSSLNGTKDYCSDDTAMMFKTTEEALECIKNPDYSKVPKMQDILVNKIGNRKKNMEKFVELLK